MELRELEFGLFDGIPDEDLPRLFPREYEHYQRSVRLSMGLIQAPHALFGYPPLLLLSANTQPIARVFA